MTLTEQFNEDNKKRQHESDQEMPSPHSTTTRM